MKVDLRKLMPLFLFGAFIYFAVADANIHGDNLAQWTKTWITAVLFVIAVIIYFVAGDDDDTDIDRN
jgi:hypothetical protein